MKGVIERTQPAHVLGRRQESPEKRHVCLFMGHIALEWLVPKATYRTCWIFLEDKIH